MKVLYVTANVLGDAGANAAEIFPRLAVADPAIEHVIVAEYERNKAFVLERHKAEFLKLLEFDSPIKQAWRSARRIAKKARDADVDFIHVFYRQPNVVLAIFLRMFLIALRARAIIIMDHRSVNLSRGWSSFTKKLRNLLMQVFVHRLAGNPWAAETNHFFIWKPKHIIDLGYDSLPAGEAAEPAPGAPTPIWFIGSLKPRNRKSEFLIDVFDKISKRTTDGAPIEIHVAGPSRPDQEQALRAIPLVTYHGQLPRNDLYMLLRQKPGIGVAFMNMEYHSFAPSLKFVEYAIMRFRIVSSDTLGLRTQAERMNLDGVVFAQESADEWAAKLIQAANDWQGLAPMWKDADKWSYESIYTRQVIGLYESLG